MKIVQLLPTISFGDAVGNDARAIEEILKEQGYDTRIYAENIDGRLPAGTASYVRDMPHLGNDDVILYHGSTGTELNYTLPSYGGRKVMIYHNITPPHFFSKYSWQSEQLTQTGLEGMRYLSDKLNYCIADSEFNKCCLIEMGYTCEIDICPILIPFSDYDKKPNSKVMARYQNDGYTNLLFVGRIAPNKKQEDVIRAFCCYQKRYNQKSRLFLVGSGDGPYYERLKKYVSLLGLEDCVIFPGHIRFDEVLAYYHLADVFLCMSEHEGFCVPLVEAMYFKIPIIAYDSSAISDTLGKGGILLDEKTPEVVSGVINRLLADSTLKGYILSKQEEQLHRFSHKAVKAELLKCLEKVIRE